jgi:hypothetical protein
MKIKILVCKKKHIKIFTTVHNAYIAEEEKEYNIDKYMHLNLHNW